MNRAGIVRENRLEPAGGSVAFSAAQSVLLFQQFARGDPPHGDDVRCCKAKASWSLKWEVDPNRWTAWRRLLGGIGGVHRTLIGVLIIVLLDNGLNLMGVNQYTQMMVKGAVVIAAVLISQDRGKAMVVK